MLFLRLYFTGGNTFVPLGIDRVTVQREDRSVAIQVIQRHVRPTEIIGAVDRDLKSEKTAIARMPIAGVIAGIARAVVFIVEVSDGIKILRPDDLPLIE